MDREWAIETDRIYHVYNRGNNRDPVFGDRSDYCAFISKLKSLATRYLIDVSVFTLMPNHYHLIVMQKLGGSLSAMMGALGTSAAARFNLKYGHVGHLFQGPFKFKPISDEVLWHVACYIHLNPVRAGLAARPEDWEYSNFVEGFLRPGTVTHGEDLLRWKGYEGYVMQVLTEEKTQKEHQNRIRVHIDRFLSDGLE